MRPSFGYTILLVGPPWAGNTLLALTIVDLAGAEAICPSHLAEALSIG